MCTGAELIPLLIAGAGTAVSVGAQQSAARKQDREAAAGILRQAQLNREAGAKVSKTLDQLEQSNPQEDIAKRQASYMDALRRAQPSTNKALPDAVGGSDRFAEDVSAARGANAAEAGTTAGLMARIDAPTIQRTREGQLANDTLSQLSLLDDRSRQADYLTRLRVSMQKPNPWAIGAGQALNGYGSTLATENSFGDNSSIWNDDTLASGLTAAQRRLAGTGNARAPYNPNRGRP